MSAATCLLSKSTPQPLRTFVEFLATVALLLQQLHLGAFRHRIDERQHLAAAQRELVDGVGRLGRQASGCATISTSMSAGISFTS